ncbi:hypothetical protein NS355_01715 [Sphingomonas yabuuchiae]|uniref:Uncharacterized protein n=1 Tax=Sphingomonas yabuuchiae TaxID=172044 RepID=A0A147IYM1_9SPHN|nr:hypothetical protein [Sphingomonas yabuuchiae]KTW00940.1 hypothetical protein NS355_01715 [Sphingomonas yabuuchiae]
MLNVVVFYAGLVGLLVYSIRCGGRPERWVAGILAASAIVDTMMVNAARGVFVVREPGILLLDVITLVAVTVVALWAERIWPMVLAAFLLVGVELQIGVWLAPVIQRQVYKLAHAYSAYPVMLILLVGIVRHRSRTRDVPERDWTIF